MKRPSRAQFDQICRLCLEGTDLVNIFERHPRTQKESLSMLVRETVEMLGLLIESDDGFPKKICIPCKDFLRQLYKFKNQCQEASDLLAEALSSYEQPRALSPLPSAAPSALPVEPSPSNSPVKPSPPRLLSLPENDQHDAPSNPALPKPHILVVPAAVLLKQEYICQSSTKTTENDSDDQESSLVLDIETETEPITEADSSSSCLPNHINVKFESIKTQEDSEYIEQEDDYSVPEEDYCEYLETETEAAEEEVIIEDDTMHAGEEEISITDLQEESSSDQHLTEICPEEEETETENNGYKDLFPSNNSKILKGQVCRICGKTSTCLKYHLMCHTGERPFACQICEKTFRTSSKLNIHVNGVHLKIRKYDCKVCDRKFLDAGNLRNHMVTHGGERKYVCDFKGCGKSFALQGTLTVHKKVHTQDKQFSCDYCPKTFLYKWLLVKHHRTHTGERPYECDVCHKKFSTITHMHTHKKTHDPEREKSKKRNKAYPE